jgi:murein DD-endopeptidase MepM/ murein hydrolase activator NlpD
LINSIRKRFSVYLLLSTSLLITFCHVSHQQLPPSKDPTHLKIIFPVKGPINLNRINPFGEPRGSRKHLGIDIFAPIGRPVLAPCNGKIVRITTQKNAGNYIWLLESGGRIIYEFMHLQKFAQGMNPGRRVKQGTIIGYVGKTGNVRGSSHLHFGMMKLAKKEDIFGKKQYLDPMIFLLKN